MADTRIRFPPFELDLATEKLWHAGQEHAVRPKPIAVLCYLVERAGQLVSKDELLKALWPDTYVSDGVLKRHIKELRKVLGDDAGTPHYIETIPRRGYRFIAKISTQSSAGDNQTGAQLLDQSHNGSQAENDKTDAPRPIPVTSSLSIPNPQSPPPTLVGRETELEFLHTCMEQVLSGKRHIVFVTGEPGIGKTTLVREFTKQVTGMVGTWVGRGHCIEQYGAGEAYLPILEALERLCCGPEGAELVNLLSRHAPTWLMQMPALIDDTELATLQQKVQGVTRERMLREMSRAVEELTADRPLVLLLEDLQWSDYSTLDLLTVLAQRQEAARLLVVGTYRPADAVLSEHPVKTVKQELQGRGQCQEIALTALSQAEIGQYVTARFANHAERPEHTEAVSSFQALVQPIYHSTGGNPLFMVNIVEDLMNRGVVGTVEGEWTLQETPGDIAIEIPDNLRQMLLKQIERLSTDEQRLLEVASVAGTDFSAAAVAVGLDAEIEQVEEWCENLSQRGHFLHTTGPHTLPNGMLTGAYGFSHALYHEALYSRLGDIRRLRLHRKIGEGIETTYGERANEIAAELSLHFERGQDYARAARYHRQAGENALRKQAPREAITHFSTGLELIAKLPDTPERVEHELRLQTALGGPLAMTKGAASPEVEAVYTRARALCQQVQETPQLFPVLYGLVRFSAVRGKSAEALDIGQQLLRLAKNTQEPALLIEAHAAVGAVLFSRGEIKQAASHLQHSASLYNLEQHGMLAFQYGEDPLLMDLIWGAWALWLQGYPNQALQQCTQALGLLTPTTHFPSRVGTYLAIAVLQQFRREPQEVQRHVETALNMIHDQEMPQLFARGIILQGWERIHRQELTAGMTQLQQGLDTYQALGAETYRPYYLSMLAEAYHLTGQYDDSLRTVLDALMLVEQTGERYYAAELHRLKGEILLAQGSKKQGANVKTPLQSPNPHIEECFQQALAIARQQEAKSLELRAAMSLGQLWHQNGKTAKAHHLVSEIYSWFTEGFDTLDLQEAKQLLEGWQ